MLCLETLTLIIFPSVELSAAKDSIAQKAYDRITEMMHIDNGFDDLSVSDRQKQRQLILSEKVDAYFAWVKLKYCIFRLMRTVCTVI